jgi:hypothetical protein
MAAEGWRIGSGVNINDGEMAGGCASASSTALWLKEAAAQQ